MTAGEGFVVAADNGSQASVVVFPARMTSVVLPSHQRSCKREYYHLPLLLHCTVGEYKRTSLSEIRDTKVGIRTGTGCRILEFAWQSIALIFSVKIKRQYSPLLRKWEHAMNLVLSARFFIYQCDMTNFASRLMSDGAINIFPSYYYSTLHGLHPLHDESQQSSPLIGVAAVFSLENISLFMKIATQSSHDKMNF
jgi:hypothetical protein